MFGIFVSSSIMSAASSQSLRLFVGEKLRIQNFSRGRVTKFLPD